MILEENTKTFNLEYWTGSKFVETLETNKPWGIVQKKKKELQKQYNYKKGQFRIKVNC